MNISSIMQLSWLSVSITFAINAMPKIKQMALPVVIPGRVFPLPATRDMGIPSSQSPGCLNGQHKAQVDTRAWIQPRLQQSEEN